MNTSSMPKDYPGNFIDWGTAIDDKGTWFTLTGGDNDEWKYLIDNHVYVWGTCNSVSGLFIAPDGYAGDKTALTAAVGDWESAQAAGIVFLPAAGWRTGTYSDTDPLGYYWSASTVYDTAYYLEFSNSKVDPNGYEMDRSRGLCVRLVTEVK